MNTHHSKVHCACEETSSQHHTTSITSSQVRKCWNDLVQLCKINA